MVRIRPATVDDAALLATMIRELAEFEHQLEWVTIRPEDLARDGFGPHPGFRALIAEWSGEPAAYALFFGYYSTWVGRGLFLEDLFVREAFRGRGIGTAMLAAVARVALAEGCYSMRWEVLNWNQSAVAMYKNLGAEFCDEWRPVLLWGEPLKHLAEIAP
jgi:GNAT superfamily N-acetyltransferase